MPRDDEFKFKHRADVLVKKWQLILNASKANGTSLGNAMSSVISNGPVSGSGFAKDSAFVKPGHGEAADTASVTQATAAIDLNGKGEGVFYFCLGTFLSHVVPDISPKVSLCQLVPLLHLIHFLHKFR